MAPAQLSSLRLKALAFALVTPCAFAQQAYEVTDLGTLGGTAAFAYGINREWWRSRRRLGGGGGGHQRQHGRG
jgi:hypothetical protein